MEKILRVELTTETFREVELNKDYLTSFVGGAGYAARTLYDMVGRETNPFSPENPLFFIAGPMVGSRFPGTTKSTVCSRSPLTGIWGESSASGSWGSEMKHAGYDGVLITGACKDPTYIWIKDGEVEIKKADSLWGQDTVETARRIKSDLSESRSRVACIGQAGERLVRYASIMTDEERAFGRAGIGAVMGSKRLKAVVVKGEKKVPLADEEMVQRLSDQARADVKSPKAPPYTAGRVRGLSVDGTAGGVEGLEKQGGLPIKNWTKGIFPEVQEIGGPNMTKTILERPGMCTDCTIITCWRFVRRPDGTLSHGPEYETIASFGSLCMNSNLESIVQANDACNRLGMDTISTGSAIAFAMECYEKGILSREKAGGLDLSWGNAEAILKLTHQIGLKEGFGAVLAEGVKRASEKIGNGAEGCAIHVKGMEPAMHDPRRWWTMALSYATSNRGACHHQGIPGYLEWGLVEPEFGFSEKLKPFDANIAPMATKFHQDFHAVFTSMGHCAFTVGGVIPFTLITEAFGAVTGRRMDRWDLLGCGERIWNLKRAFNARLGVTEKDDSLPQRFTCEPLSEGLAAGKTPPLEAMLREYYLLRGWQNGKPTRAKLNELGMSDVASNLWER